MSTVYIPKIYTITFLHVILSLLSCERKNLSRFTRLSSSPLFGGFSMSFASSKSLINIEQREWQHRAPSEALVTNINKPFVISFFNQKPVQILHTYPFARNMFASSILNFSVGGGGGRASRRQWRENGESSSIPSLSQPIVALPSFDFCKHEYS